MHRRDTEAMRSVIEVSKSLSECKKFGNTSSVNSPTSRIDYRHRKTVKQ